jgi:hypothetical protein
MKKRYNQAEVTVLVDGIPLMDLAEGASVTVTFAGGEVARTEGTDGAGVNIATEQGGDVKIKLREDSKSLNYMRSVRMTQRNSVSGIGGVTVQVRSGTSVFHTLFNAFVSLPGELSTGDKKMGSQEFSFVGTQMESDDLLISTALASI